MSFFRISSNQIKAIKVEDKKTWPVDLQVWVELSIEKPWRLWDAPFYIGPAEMKVFKAIILAGIKGREERLRRMDVGLGKKSRILVYIV